MFYAGVEAGLQRLSGDFRRTIELVDIAGLSYAEPPASSTSRSAG